MCNLFALGKFIARSMNVNVSLRTRYEREREFTRSRSLKISFLMHFAGWLCEAVTWEIFGFLPREVGMQSAEK